MVRMGICICSPRDGGNDGVVVGKPGELEIGGTAKMSMR